MFFFMILFSVPCFLFDCLCYFLCLSVSSSEFFFLCWKRLIVFIRTLFCLLSLNTSYWVIWNLSKKCTHEHSYEHSASFHCALHVFIVMVFRSFSSRTPRKFQVFFPQQYCCPLRSTGQLSFRTPCLFKIFVIPKTMYFFICRQIVTNISSGRS